MARTRIFAVLVALIGCMGAWLLLTNVVGEPAPGPELAASASRIRYTVRLMEFDSSPAKRAAAEQLVAQERILRLSGGHEFRLLEFPDGRLALCCGRFEEAASPELRRLARSFREYREGGRALFQDAAVLPFTD